MNQQQTLRVSLETPHPMQNLLTSLHLLDLDKLSDWPGINLQSLSSKDNVQSQKSRIQTAEWILYRLYQIWDPDDSRNRLQPFFPPLEPLQSINLRAALFRCLNELKRTGILGKEITLRKSMFDDCKGEKFRDLLSVFSAVVLRKVFAADNKSGFNSIAGRLALSEDVPKMHRRSLLPLAIAHKASLVALLQRKEDLRSYYHDFNCALKQKDQNLQRKFEKIIENQEFLDRNSPSEDTVERVAKVLDQYWQGDRDLVGTIAEGEERGLRDSLLDQQFSSVWTSVNEGKFSGDISTSRHGLLEDLERRTAIQHSRLLQWKNFKTELSQGMADPKAETTEDVFRHALRSPQARTPRLKTSMGKDLVFSPRKSPRKSMWPVAVVDNDSQSPSNFDEFSNNKLVARRASSPSQGQIKDVLARETHLDREPLDSVDNSGLSEETADWHTVQDGDKTDGAAEFEIKSASPKQTYSPTNLSPGARGRGPAGDTRSSDVRNGCQTLEAINESDLAQRLESLSMNTVATPPPNKLSLVERTRQSMAIASPDREYTNDNLIRAPSLASRPSPLPEPTVFRATLAERTRQSISLVSSHPKPNTSHNRRSSKLYPTNQFETPRRQNTVQKLTPPEELFSPGAGYDSVFKSRPKIAHSPATSPVASEEETIDRQWAERGHVPLDDSSPLARLVAKT